MHLQELTLENFRNVPFARLAFGADAHYLYGANGQGKTNCLEAVSLITALRSFRTTEIQPMIRQGEKLARIRFVVTRQSSAGTEEEIVLTLGRKRKVVEIDGRQESRFADYIGRYPTVVFSSDDIQLLRGAPQLRRRYLDMTLAATDSSYFQALRQYHRGLSERNKALRGKQPSEEVIRAYDRVLSPLVWQIHEARLQAAVQLGDFFNQAYAGLSAGEDGEGRLLLHSSVKVNGPDDYAAVLKQSRREDLALGSTLRGPHRDDLILSYAGNEARRYASEGQQRGFVLALRFAQLRYIESCNHEPPIILADDVLGELDPIRRERFWQTLDGAHQVIATGTRKPEAAAGTAAWVIHEVVAGAFQRVD